MIKAWHPRHDLAAKFVRREQAIGARNSNVAAESSPPMSGLNSTIPTALGSAFRKATWAVPWISWPCRKVPATRPCGALIRGGGFHWIRAGAGNLLVQLRWVCREFETGLKTSPHLDGRDRLGNEAMRFTAALWALLGVLLGLTGSALGAVVVQPQRLDAEASKFSKEAFLER